MITMAISARGAMLKPMRTAVLTPVMKKRQGVGNEFAQDGHDKKDAAHAQGGTENRRVEIHPDADKEKGAEERIQGQKG